jgi:hypothetical protein
MQSIYPSDNRAMSLVITVTCNGTKRFRVCAEDNGKKNSKYADREIVVDGKRVIYFSFPVSPRNLLITCVNLNDVKDKEFRVDIKESSLKKYNIWINEETQSFVQMAIYFSQICGFTMPEKSGTMYQSTDEKFKIKYFPIIKDYKTGSAISTPARIGHNSGAIEVAAVKFVRYTIPMRMCILLHEFSHKYKNPKIGLDISNEFGADINALYIYLGLGFSKIDAICVFANVFLKAQTDQNIQRMRKIIDYINRFENQEFADIQ